VELKLNFLVAFLVAQIFLRPFPKKGWAPVRGLDSRVLWSALLEYMT